MRLARGTVAERCQDPIGPLDEVANQVTGRDHLVHHPRAGSGGQDPLGDVAVEAAGTRPAPAAQGAELLCVGSASLQIDQPSDDGRRESAAGVVGTAVDRRPPGFRSEERGLDKTYRTFQERTPIGPGANPRGACSPIQTGEKALPQRA